MTSPMTVYNRKHSSVEARQHRGPNLVVISDRKGQQTASQGDYLVTDPASENPRGSVYMMPKAEFEAELELAAADAGVAVTAAGNEGAEADQGNQTSQGKQAAGETAKQETGEEVHA